MVSHAVTSLVAVCGFTLALAPAAAPPVMFRGGPEHTGVYASAVPTLSAVAWKFRTAGRVLSSPAVSGNTVYVGSTDNHMYAVDRATGTQRWRVATRGPVSSSPAVANGLVFFGSVDGNFCAVGVVSIGSWDRHLYAIDAVTGALRWMHDNWVGWTIASPAGRAGVVYFPTSAGWLQAVDVRDGTIRAQFQTDG